ncbi:MAG: glycosyltransferase family 2 protein, partial [Bdellovibrionales bacterium]|nr:glycosyltransferase family 2 protein [Bdellovibrionales bacterium]
MQIDVIIPTFNRAHTVSRAIDSVLAQTYQNFILHIVDDGSTDATDNVLSQYANHPKIVLYKIENRGVSHARNFAAN